MTTKTLDQTILGKINVFVLVHRAILTIYRKYKQMSYKRVVLLAIKPG